MSSRSYSIETRASGAVILGAPRILGGSLAQELLLSGVKAITPTEVNELVALRTTHDLDYIVLFSGSNINPEMVDALLPFLNSGESRLHVVDQLDSSPHTIPLSPITRHITISDYVGGGELSSALLTTWLQSIVASHSLAIPGDGLGEISLLSLGDLAHLISLTIVRPLSHPEERVILGNPTPISHLNLAYLVRSNLPFKVNLSFQGGSQSEIPPFDPGLFSPALDQLGYQLLGSIEEDLHAYLHATLKNSPPPPPIKPNPREVISKAPSVVTSLPHKSEDIPKKLTPLKIHQPVFVPLQPKKVRKPFKFPHLSLKLPPRAKRTGPPNLLNIFGRGLVIAFALYLGTIAFALTISGLTLRHIFQSLQNNDLPKISKFNNFAGTYLEANWVAFSLIPGIAQKSAVSDVSLLLNAYNQSLAIFTSAESLSQNTAVLSGYVFGNSSVDIAQTISQSRLLAEELYQKLSLLDGALPEVAPSLIPAKYHQQYLGGRSKLVQVKRSITTTKALLATAPDVIGLGSRKKYGVLFQNNMELRATGGFIGSFAILSFENGKLYDMPIYDVYQADGQLKGHVEPPKPIKDILGEANWYLRDSNFDPDFPTTARRAEWFIKKTLNLDLDGTIAVTVNTLASLLEATGPLTIPDYDETITGGNLYERVQFHAEVNFFPGSTQKKEFISTVASVLFNKLPDLGAGEGLKLISALSSSVEQKDLLVSLLSAPTDHVFKILGWNGEIADFPCPISLDCHKDYAMVVDSNFGVNKANYYIKRQIEEIITLEKNLSVNHALRIKYQNTATSTAWPAGIYKNYQRLYLPIGSIVNRVRVGDQELDPKQYTITSEHDKFILAYLVSVPINSAQLVEVEYSTPQLPQDNTLIYTWYWQKQPGTSADDSLTVYLNYPLYLKPNVISPTGELANQQLKFNFKNDTDHRVTVKFSK